MLATVVPGSAKCSSMYFTAPNTCGCLTLAAEAFAATLVAAGVEHEIVGDLETALRAAAKGARESMGPEPVVLLSPAAASFDQYRDFEARGDAFRVAVQLLLGAEEGAR